MPKRIPVNTIVLVRDGKRVVPEIGKSFDFTSEELTSIKEVAPDAVRMPVNESVSAEAAAAAKKAEDEAAAVAAKKAADEAAAKKTGKKIGSAGSDEAL